MPLSNDNRMYYRGSFVGLKQADGSVLPFYVDEVYCDRGVYDPVAAYEADGGDVHRDYDEDTDEFEPSYDVEIPASYYYCQAAYDSLRFTGRVFQNGSFGNLRNDVPLTDLVLESPSAGYIVINGNPVYTEYRPIRQAKKGLTSERLSYIGNTGSSFNRVVEELYKTNRDDRIKMNGALFLGDDVMYKGVRIGHLNNGVVVIDVQEAAYLQRWIAKELGECRIRVQ